MATQYAICTGPITLVSAVAKTCIELPTSATAGLTIIGMELSWSATNAIGCVVEWMTYTTTGTGGTVITPIKYGTGQGVAANTGTIKINAAEPTTPVSGGLPSWVIPLPGMYSVLYPAGREFFRPASTNTSLRLTQPTVQVAPGNTVRINVYFEQ